MKTSILGRTGIKTGIIGLGLEHLENAPYEEVALVVEEAIAAGACYMDLFMASPNIRDFMGKLMKGRRNKFQIQGHIGACLQDGQYYRTRDPVIAERHAEDLLTRLDTDYLDTLMIHFVDEPDEWAEVSAPGGLLEIAHRWKKEGKARAVGMSSHKAAASMAAVESGLVDILMFPVNPSFDLLPGETKLEALWEPDPYTGIREAGNQPVYSRRDLYLACERHGVAIVSMKTYAAGWMFRPDNPGGIMLSAVQCLQYALSQPGVAVVLPGCRTPEQMRAALAWLDASDTEKDYSIIMKKTNWALKGICMYCNHCLPCPADIDIAAVTRLFDSARKETVTPTLAAAYGRLSAVASDCVQCGACEERCPFSVAVQANMEEATALFGK